MQREKHSRREGKTVSVLPNVARMVRVGGGCSRR